VIAVRPRLALFAIAFAAIGVAACSSSTVDDAGDPRTDAVEAKAPTESSADARPDARLVTHAFEPSTPTEAGLAYVEFVADVHERADLAEDLDVQAEILADGLDRAPPEGVAEGEVLQLELGARLCETHLERGSPQAARDALVDMLDPQRSLPLDRASAHALTALGDAAKASDDDALAAGSYARAVRMMSLLADDLAEKAGVGDVRGGETP